MILNFRGSEIYSILFWILKLKAMNCYLHFFLKNASN